MKKREAGDGDASPLSELLPGLVQGMRIAPAKKPPTLQGKHHHTRGKQIDALLEIPDSSPDMGFMTRLLTLCSLPRTDPGNRLQYKRENGPFKLVMIAGGDNKLPFRQSAATVARLGLHGSLPHEEPRYSARSFSR